MTDQTFQYGVSDPADFTVDQVVAHLETADPTEFARVQDLEADGKARVGITSQEPADQSEPVQETNDDGEPVGVLGLPVGAEYTTDDNRTAQVVSIDGT